MSKRAAATTASSVPRVNYAQIQTDELQALQAIYMDDFVEIQSKSVWSKAGDKAFTLVIRAPSDNEMFVTIECTLPITYPKTVPRLVLGASQTRDKDIAAIRQVIADKPGMLLGEPMIFEIAGDIQDRLEDAYNSEQRGSQLPSLEEERAILEANTVQVARARAADELQRSQDEHDFQTRNMRRLAEEELKRRQEISSRQRNPTRSAADLAQSTAGPRADIVFDRSIVVTDSDVSFSAVSIVASNGTGDLTEALLVKPHTSIESLQKMASNNLLILKRPRKLLTSAKLSILELEDQLAWVKKLKHPNLLSILEFRIDQTSDELWSVDILSEFAARGNLEDWLEVIDTVPLAKMKTYAFELLGALDFLHANGLAHGRVHSGNILFRSSSSGASVLLSDAVYQNTLYQLSDGSPGTFKPQQFGATPFASMPDEPTSKATKSDIWQLGIVFVQMLLGKTTPEKYTSPSHLFSSSSLSGPLEAMLKPMLAANPRHRPRAFDLRTYEFLRCDAPVLAAEAPLSPLTPKRQTANSYFSVKAMSRQSQSDTAGAQTTTTSRYDHEWDELGRLGKGGYGEVVKTRNKFDGRVYAVKKITHKSPSELNWVLSEVHLLAGLNHPYVVRYYTAWPEEESVEVDTTDGSETTSGTADVIPLQYAHDFQQHEPSFDITNSKGGLDFMSSSGYPNIQFGEDEDDNDSSDNDDDDDVHPDGSDSKSTDEHEDDSNDSGLSEDSDDSESDSVFASRGEKRAEIASKPQRLSQSVRRDSRVTRSTLYIQMEFCERLTLRDMIRKGLTDQVDQIWATFRQILEGLVHIHGHGIIHRDLKPENIFIDSLNNPKIGDFGLATTSRQLQPTTKFETSTADSIEMTRDVGTTLYVAPELQVTSTSQYTDKVDQYSLGIILFEMCHKFETGMERLQVLTALRQKFHVLTEDFKSSRKVLQGEIILSLLAHKSSERPSSAELLRSGKVPLKIEDNAIRLALNGLSDSTSPYYHQMMSALFTQGPTRQMQEYMWDISTVTPSQLNVEYALLQDMVHERILKRFRLHGAVQTSRHGVFPRSDLYSNDVVQMLDSSGTLVQLPYDLTMPYARLVARQSTGLPEKAFTFGTVFRSNAAGTAPRSLKEADFDIITPDARDLALKEAEVLKVMDGVLDEFPCFNQTTMCYHISHGKILDTIMAHCRVPAQLRAATKARLGRLGIASQTWDKIRTELRGPGIGLNATSLDDLAKFDFRDTPERALSRLQAMVVDSKSASAMIEASTHIAGLTEFAKRLGVHRKIYISPLSNFNEAFYQDGIMFQCLFDGKKRDVLAAGGRYDSLIAGLQSQTQGNSTTRQQVHGVGLNIAWERIVTAMARFSKASNQNSKFLKKHEVKETKRQLLRRCDVLVAAYDRLVLQSSGLRLCAELWAEGISTEIAQDVHLFEDFESTHREELHNWWVMIKHDEYGSGKPDLKIRNCETNVDVDLRSADLVSHLRTELREKKHRDGNDGRKVGFSRQTSQNEATDGNNANKVQVLLANHKSKKINKWKVVEAAQQRALELAKSFTDGPIASIETRDEVLEKLRETRLSDGDSWRRLIQDVPVTEKKYLQELMDLLLEFKTDHGNTSRKAFVYNFRTGSCIDYDLLE